MHLVLFLLFLLYLSIWQYVYTDNKSQFVWFWRHFSQLNGYRYLYQWVEKKSLGKKNTELNFETFFTHGQFQSVNKTLPVVLYAWVWSAKQSLIQVTVMYIYTCRCLQIWIHFIQREIWHLLFLILIIVLQ